MSDDLGKTLLSLARSAIAEQLGDAPLPETAASQLGRPGACFVTLTKEGKLRGCIGSLQAWRPLREDVRANACAAAFRDPRFPPVAREELAGLHVEVSLLSEPQAMSFAGEDDALGQLRPGIDGVVFEYGNQRSTFLPQVWADLPDPRQFLAQLKIKAGLPPDFWSAEVRLSRYQAKKWKEEQ
jgi:AmmeMemoRadiSam system protein A